MKNQKTGGAAGYNSGSLLWILKGKEGLPGVPAGKGRL